MVGALRPPVARAASPALCPLRPIASLATDSLFRWFLTLAPRSVPPFLCLCLRSPRALVTRAGTTAQQPKDDAPPHIRRSHSQQCTGCTVGRAQPVASDAYTHLRSARHRHRIRLCRHRSSVPPSSSRPSVHLQESRRQASLHERRIGRGQIHLQQVGQSTEGRAHCWRYATRETHRATREWQTAREPRNLLRATDARGLNHASRN